MTWSLLRVILKTNFKMFPYSSNDDPLNIRNRTIYLICRIHSGYKFQLFSFSKDGNQKCDRFIPKNHSELAQIVENIQNYMFWNSDTRDVGTIRFWTDYQRTNETHFWSKIANTWWSQCNRSTLLNPNYSKFPGSITMNGHKKIKNVLSRTKAGCICIGKVI